VGRRIGSICVALLAAGGGVWAEAQNLFEWSAVAPIVVEAQVTGEEGKFTTVFVRGVFRGDLTPSSQVRIDIKEANRSRSRNADPKPLKLELGADYLLLLEPSPERGQSCFRLVRGVRGAERLPQEGAAVILNALPEFIAIQDQKSESTTWRRFTEMLEENNPVLLENALDQFIKFRRGEADLVYSLRPLLVHPRADIRQRSAVLIRQIVDMFPVDTIPEEAGLRTDLVGLARRDPTVEVRIQATEALGAFDDRSVKTILEEIADSDPEQDVRYVAEKLLYERRLRAERGSN
jgi:hypothetical protein